MPSTGHSCLLSYSVCLCRSQSSPGYDAEQSIPKSLWLNQLWLICHPRKAHSGSNWLSRAALQQGELCISVHCYLVAPSLEASRLTTIGERRHGQLPLGHQVVHVTLDHCLWASHGFWHTAFHLSSHTCLGEDLELWPPVCHTDNITV